MTVGPCRPVQVDSASSSDGCVDSGWCRPGHAALAPTVTLDAERRVSYMEPQSDMTHSMRLRSWTGPWMLRQVVALI